jgi:ATPase subunit of ABC transporter with duplicated ATPase domains
VPTTAAHNHRAGVNGAGKTTQLQIVMGRLQPDAGEVVKAKKNMKVAYLAQVREGHPGERAWPDGFTATTAITAVLLTAQYPPTPVRL